MKGLLAPTYEKVRQGTVEVRQLFRISQGGHRGGLLRHRWQSGPEPLRQGAARRLGHLGGQGRYAASFKDDVREVAAGYECGISLEGFDDLEEGEPHRDLRRADRRTGLTVAELRIYVGVARLALRCQAHGPAKTVVRWWLRFVTGSGIGLTSRSTRLVMLRILRSTRS